MKKKKTSGFDTIYTQRCDWEQRQEESFWCGYINYSGHFQSSSVDPIQRQPLCYNWLHRTTNHSI